MRGFGFEPPAAMSAHMTDVAPDTDSNAKAYSVSELAFALKRMKELGLVAGGDAATDGIGIMKEERWKASYDYMVSAGLLKAETNWKDAFTTDYVKDLKIKPD